MELCNETITLKINGLDDDGYDTYTDVTIRGVSWFKENLHSVTGEGLKSADRIIIRIPAEVFPDVEIVPGMTILHGADSVTVLSWTDNRRARAPHVKVVCA